MSKQLFFDIEARNKMKKGVDTLANAVKVTLGPKGRNVVLEKKFGRMVSYQNNTITSVTLGQAVHEPSFVKKNSYIVQAAKGLGISFGD